MAVSYIVLWIFYAHFMQRVFEFRKNTLCKLELPYLQSLRHIFQTEFLMF